MYILDTNVISELRQGKPKQSQTVRAWAATQPANQLFLTAITMLELEKGVLSLERRTPPEGRAIRSWLNGVRSAFSGRILAFTDNTAVLCAAMHVPDPHAERDAMIAASALEHKFSLVTRNTKDFDGIGVTLINPWLKN
jgi:toxin FitB